MTYRIKVDNVQKSVDEEMRHIEDDEGEYTFRFDGGPADSRSEFNLFNYHPLEKIYDFVTQVNLELVSKELNHLAAILYYYAGSFICLFVGHSQLV